MVELKTSPLVKKVLVFDFMVEDFSREQMNLQFTYLLT